MTKIKVKHKVSRWNAPPKNDVRLLGMPNIPDALQGPGCQPRTIVGNKGWDIMRKKCYADAGYKCEICGYEHQFPADLHAHEVYDIDYTTGVERFVRLACLCKRCVDEDTEVLTADGWKKIPLVTTADRVACWGKNGSIKFEHPLATVVSHKEKAIKITRGDSTLYFSEDHRLPLKVASKQSPTHGEIHDVLAGDYHASHYYNWLTSGNTVGNGHLTPEERVFIAIEADGCLTWDKENVGTRASENGERQRAYNSRYNSEQYRYTYTIHLVKTRKIERLKQLLAESSLQYEIKKEVSDSYCDFNIWTNVECKHFKECFSQEMPAEKALEFIEELVFWDGTYAQATTSWYTNKPEEVAFVQGVAAQCGIRTQVSVINRIGNLRKGQWKTPYERLTYAVSFRSINTEICAREMKEEKIDWGKDMYCITTPTSYFIARRDNLVFVTGNCHIYWIHSGRALTMYKHGDPLYSKEKLLEGAEHGFKLISEYNKTHKKPIYAFMSIAQYSWQEELSEPMRELVEKYNIEFYCPVAGKKQANWEDWKLIWNGKEYPTPYKNHEEYVAKMRELNKKNATHTERKSAIDNEVVKALQKELNNF